MTDNEIIKALECCSKDDCDNCPNDFGNCYSNLAGYALNIIKRQQAEIERLKNNPTLPKSGFINLLCGAFIYTETLEQYNKFRRTFKAEAYKEFAERLLKKELESEYFSHIAFQSLNFDTNKLLKELVGDSGETVL